MGIDSFLDMMSQQVTLEAAGTQDKYGKVASYGAAVTYPAAIDGRTRVIHDAQGRELVSLFTIYLGGTPVVGLMDRITLPAGYVPSQPPILAVNMENDENGPHHTVVYLGMR